MRLAALGEIALVIFFRRAKISGAGSDLRHAGRGSVHSCRFFFRASATASVRANDKNHRTILRADIRPCRFNVVGLWFDQKTSSNVRTNLCRIEFDFDDFGVTGVSSLQHLRSSDCLLSAA